MTNPRRGRRYLPGVRSSAPGKTTSHAGEFALPVSSAPSVRTDRLMTNGPAASGRRRSPVPIRIPSMPRDR